MLPEGFDDNGEEREAFCSFLEAILCRFDGKDCTAATVYFWEHAMFIIMLEGQHSICSTVY